MRPLVPRAPQTYFDYVTIGGTRFSGSSGPANVPMAMGATLQWYADGSVTYGGWTICGSTTPLFWQITSGSSYCHLSNGGTCVTDGVGSHGNNEACTVSANAALYATATYFQTEVRLADLIQGSWSPLTS